MRVVISADDFALTYATSENICKAAIDGCVNSVSVVSNGYDFDSSIKLLEEFGARCEVAVHLNLCEGLPVAPASEVRSLLNEEGNLHFSFQGLWRKYLSSSFRKRQVLRLEIKTELDAQIAKVRDSLPNVRKLGINSHQHFHLMPPVFDALLELHERHSFHYVRIVHEPLFISPDWLLAAKNVVSLNLAKHMLLNFLSEKHASRLRSARILFPDMFFGVLYTGFMSENTVLKALSLLKRRVHQGHFIELLLHPGRASPQERVFWRDRQPLADYYCSEWRDRENGAARAPAVLSLLGDLRAGG